MLSLILKIGLPLIAIILVIVLLAMGYVKAPPDTAYLISGLRKKTVIGKASIRIPFLERIDKVSLKLIPIDVKTSSSVPTADYINIRVDAVVNVKVSDDPEKLKLAAQNFLNVKPEYIGTVAREVLEGNMREIVGQMRLEEMVSDRQKFAEKVKENAQPDLAGMGLDVISFNVQNFIDDNQVIENLGVDNIVQISKNAAVSKANAEKEIAIAQAKAAKEANDAKVEADMQIAKANAKAEKESQEAKIDAETQIAQKQNELNVRKAELKQEADTKQAIADAAMGIQAEEQRKLQEIATADANLARQEKEIELKEREVAIKEKALDAEVKKVAEAKKYAAQQQADAELYKIQRNSEAELFERQRQAEAEKFEAEQKAEATKAASEATKIAMENEAAGIKAKGEAEAAAIQAKAVAEAEGILKKAEAMKQYGESAQMSMQLDALKVYFEQLPAIAKAVSAPMQQIDKITMYGDGNTSKLTGEITTTMQQIIDGVKDSTGIDPMALLSGMLGSKL